MSDPFKVRASSWGSLFDCAHRWEGIHLLGMRSGSGPRSALGTAIHAGTAHYDTQRANGQEPDSMQAGEVLIDALHHPREEVSWRNSDITRVEAERIGLTLLARYCTEISPRFDYIAVEMTLNPMVIDCGDGIAIELTGSMDRARVLRNEYGVAIADLKTGTRATQDSADGRRRVAKTKGFAAQIGTYEILFEHTTGETPAGPGEIIGMNTNKPEIAVGEIPNARARLVGSEDSPGLMQYAAAMFRTGLFPPNPQSTLCSEKYCPRWHRCNHHD